VIITTQSAYGGRECNTDAESRNCNTQICIIIAKWNFDGNNAASLADVNNANLPILPYSTTGTTLHQRAILQVNESEQAKVEWCAVSSGYTGLRCGVNFYHLTNNVIGSFGYKINNGVAIFNSPGGLFTKDQNPIDVFSSNEYLEVKGGWSWDVGGTAGDNIGSHYSRINNFCCIGRLENVDPNAFTTFTYDNLIIYGTSCAPNFYLDSSFSTGKCKPCPSGSTSPAGGTCTCKDGYEQGTTPLGGTTLFTCTNRNVERELKRTLCKLCIHFAALNSDWSQFGDECPRIIRDCPCNALPGAITGGYMIGAVQFNRTSPPFYTVDSSICQIKICPDNSVGINVLSGCTCSVGYVGTIVASFEDPFYTGSCVSSAVEP